MVYGHSSEQWVHTTAAEQSVLFCVPKDVIFGFLASTLALFAVLMTSYCLSHSAVSLPVNIGLDCLHFLFLLGPAKLSASHILYSV